MKKGTIYYKLNNNAYIQYKGPITISKSSTISYYVKDLSGRVSKTTTLKYTIDKTSPKITKITPKNGYTKVAAKKQQIVIKFSEKNKSNNK
ncbi:Ig-like domain-containing protein [Methanobrevibacter arboriphilus]|uniref:Ig-like domain-containing protein n=1 Tax=Methanobrevibacter arboriphilus TaxID=39441 RepID=UPI00373FC968